ncbi:hypothetical protein [Reichenbachiella versicolor]|uniref:hypothetical protein n=1 Tax=Reichenbachiella versicolor TaxID=1821036 RepID=UPI000D6E9783|nr:hypothetical protein [Reichenbachiella versicolor]
MEKPSISKLFLAVLLGHSLLYSCGDKDSDSPEPATVESSKDRMVDDGVALSNSLEKLKDEPAVTALIHLSSLGDEEDGFAIAEFIDQSITQKVANGDIVSTSRVLEEDVVDLDQEWNDNKGTYEYNSNTDDFDFTEGGNSIVIKFPSKEGISNNSSITLSNYTSKTTSNADVSNELEVLPKSINVSLSVDNIDVMSVTGSMSYDSEDLPNDVDASVTIGDFSLNADYSNDGSNVKYELSFKEGENIILLNSASISGNISYSEFSDFDEEKGELSDFNLNSLTYTTQLINTKIELALDNGNKLLSEIEGLIEPSEDEIEKVLNDNISVTAVFADTNQKIADVSLDIVTETYTETYGGYVYEYEERNIELIMTFDDGSKVALEDFFDQQFNQVITDLENLLEE